MVTKPAPDVEAALLAAEGLPLVLVGGQATLLWAETYSLRHAAATEDVDWHVTSKAAARSYAERLQVSRFEESHEGFHLAVAETAEGTLVDFLTTVFGVDANQDLPARASVLTVGGVELRVIHPVHLLASKLANLRLPGRGSPMDVEQARVAIEVAARFCAAAADNPPAKAGKVPGKVPPFLPRPRNQRGNGRPDEPACPPSSPRAARVRSVVKTPTTSSS